MGLQLDYEIWSVTFWSYTHIHPFFSQCWLDICLYHVIKCLYQIWPYTISPPNIDMKNAWSKISTYVVNFVTLLQPSSHQWCSWLILSFQTPGPGPLEPAALSGSISSTTIWMPVPGMCSCSFLDIWNQIYMDLPTVACRCLPWFPRYVPGCHSA